MEDGALPAVELNPHAVAAPALPAEHRGPLPMHLVLAVAEIFALGTA